MAGAGHCGVFARVLAELSNPLANPGSGRPFDPTVYVLRVKASVGSKDVASIRITQG